MQTPPTAVQLTPEQILGFAKQWKQVKQWMDDAKANEAKLRAILAEALFSDQKTTDGSFAEGTLKGGVPGLKAKLKQKRNYTVSEALMFDVLKQADLTPEQGDGLIKGKPELSLTVFKKLPPDKQEIINQMLTITPASIELEIELDVA